MMTVDTSDIRTLFQIATRYAFSNRALYPLKDTVNSTPP